MKEKPAAVVAHNDAEVTAALEALYQNPAQLLKLKRYAQLRVNVLGRAAEDRDHEDLLSQAVTRTLAGERIWNRAAVDIAGHLIGVMQSISSHWGEQIKARGTRTYSESEVTCVTPEGQEVNALQQIPCNRPSAERILDAQTQMQQIKDALRQDKLVTEIIDGLSEGMSGPEIQEALGISKTEYETAMKRLRRHARALREGEVGHA